MRIMRALKKHGAVVAAAVAAAAALVLGGTPSASAAPAHVQHVSPYTLSTATLQAADITFYNGSDGKDWDTLVSTAVVTPTNSSAAWATSYYTGFPDNSTTGPYSLAVNHVTSGALDNGHITISIQPNGNDTWWFSFVLNLRFSDGTTQSIYVNAGALDQNVKSKTWGFSY